MKHFAFFVSILVTSCHEKTAQSLEQEQSQMSKSIPGKTITMAQLEEMFAGASWDLSKKMLWGYFFTHKEPKALEKTRDQLVSRGYRYVDIYQSDQADQDGPRLWWLHVEKAEVHTPQSLDARNDELYILANSHGLDSYDGMDVGPIGSSDEQITDNKRK